MTIYVKSFLIDPQIEGLPEGAFAQKWCVATYWRITWLIDESQKSTSYSVKSVVTREEKKGDIFLLESRGCIPRWYELIKNKDENEYEVLEKKSREDETLHKNAITLKKFPSCLGDSECCPYCRENEKQQHENKRNVVMSSSNNNMSTEQVVPSVENNGTAISKQSSAPTRPVWVVLTLNLVSRSRKIFSVFPAIVSLVLSIAVYFVLMVVVAQRFQMRRTDRTYFCIRVFAGICLVVLGIVLTGAFIYSFVVVLLFFDSLLERDLIVAVLWIWILFLCTLNFLWVVSPGQALRFAKMHKQRKAVKDVLKLSNLRLTTNDSYSGRRREMDDSFSSVTACRARDGDDDDDATCVTRTESQLRHRRLSDDGDGGRLSVDVDMDRKVMTSIVRMIQRRKYERSLLESVCAKVIDGVGIVTFLVWIPLIVYFVGLSFGRWPKFLKDDLKSVNNTNHKFLLKLQME